MRRHSLWLLVPHRARYGLSDRLQDETDEEMCEIFDGLVVAIIEKQKEAIMLAHDIVTATDRRRAGSDSLGDVLEVNAAIQRCMLAIDQAEKALKPSQESFADGMARIQRMAAPEKRKPNKRKKPTLSHSPLSTIPPPTSHSFRAALNGSVAGGSILCAQPPLL
jgi:hypothetical protein